MHAIFFSFFFFFQENAKNLCVLFHSIEGEEFVITIILRGHGFESRNYNSVNTPGGWQ
jgi:hypothetical protein